MIKTEHKETTQDIADRYCQHSKIFPLIEQISDYNLRQGLHKIYCERFIEQYKGKTTKPSLWEVTGGREYDSEEILDYGKDILMVLNIVQLSAGKVPVHEHTLRLF
jgi:hypothetical protein